ncbi:MAG: hypothetical protein MUC91_04530 [Verrucomicrobia bacterium]|nr:hypothetical protein [Verrucomicrobiota bacterium]
MSRPLVILLAVVLAAVALVAGSFLVASRMCSRQFSRPTDDLAWLQMEFHLGKGQMARVRELHDRYLPVCQSYCDQITAEKRSLQALLDEGRGATEEAVAKLNEIARIRAQCQASMLLHFEEVSRVMPPEQARRYLEEMRRLTLGFHEQIENSMSGDQADGHAHH